MTPSESPCSGMGSGRDRWDGIYAEDGVTFGSATPSPSPQNHEPRSLSSSLPAPFLTVFATDTTPNAPAPSRDVERDHLSPMARKFQIAAQLESAGIQASPVPEPWKPVYYFFYGSLMDDEQLTTVLRLTSPPVLRPASIVGYSIKLWGPYPALVDGPPGNVVNGMMYEVRRENHERRLAYYETSSYKCVSCPITPGTGEEQITGKTFVWAGEPEELSEGTFDLEAWRKARSGSESP